MPELARRTGRRPRPRRNGWLRARVSKNMLTREKAPPHHPRLRGCEGRGDSRGWAVKGGRAWNRLPRYLGARSPCSAATLEFAFAPFSIREVAPSRSPLLPQSHSAWHLPPPPPGGAIIAAGRRLRAADRAGIARATRPYVGASEHPMLHRSPAPSWRRCRRAAPTRHDRMRSAPSASKSARIPMRAARINTPGDV